jgi:hypothetical protein
MPRLKKQKFGRRLALGVGSLVFMVAAFLPTAGGANTSVQAADTASTAAVVDVPQGLTTRLTPEDVMQIVARQLPDAQIERITARALLSQARTVEPHTGFPTPGRDGGPIWIVRARGSFVGTFVPPGHLPIRSNTCYFLIADQTGEVFGIGMP